MNYIKYDFKLRDAVWSPRIHLEGNDLYFEPGVKIQTNDIPDNLSLHPFDEKNLFFGGVNAVTLTDGASDPRRDGLFEIV